MFEIRRNQNHKMVNLTNELYKIECLETKNLKTSTLKLAEIQILKTL